MTAFFDNPGVCEVALDDATRAMVKFLQAKNNARTYYLDGSIAFEAFDLANMLETRRMSFVPRNG